MVDSSIKPSDADVVQAVLAGNINAFETLMDRYSDQALTIVKRHIPAGDVEDILQDVFIRAYQSLSTYEGRGGGFKSWLSSIAVRTCYDHWRTLYRSKEVPFSSITDAHEKWLEDVVAERSEDALIEKGRAREARELLEWAMARLSAEERMVVDLLYLEGMPGKEAAALLGWSAVNVKVRAYRARKKLNKILQGLIRHEERGR